MDVGDILARRFGNQAVDQPDDRRIILRVEQVFRRRNIVDQQAEIVAAADGTGGEAFQRVIGRQQLVELGAVDKLDRQRPAGDAPHLGEHARVLAASEADGDAAAHRRR